MSIEERGLQVAFVAEEIIKNKELDVKNLVTRNLKRILEAKLGNVEEKPL